MNDVGPHFAYERAPRLFGGRVGEGPLEIVWDTSILLDYFFHGSAMWEGEPFDTTDEDYAAELDALQWIVELWMRRDLRFRVLERSINDARSEIAERRANERRAAVDELARALQLDGWHHDARERAESYATDPKTVASALIKIPEGGDRDLVATTLAVDAHVFLTRDNRVLRAAGELLPCGLLLASPADLLEELAACGALDALLAPDTVWWPLPDLQRSAHLIAALPSWARNPALRQSRPTLFRRYARCEL